jgi:AraC-like DNA-binding protein
MENKLLEKSRKCFKINSLTMRIASLKNKLANDDYKIIKCMESYLVDKEAPLPYEIEEIAEERNAIRETINALEAEIKTITSELK